ncbi:MAG: hypothetical protein P8P74_14670 [Crocinitomicaceae bacterium]|nr:hypothetical protein [Crocinitomicaceae bacterium]
MRISRVFFFLLITGLFVACSEIEGDGSAQSEEIEETSEDIVEEENNSELEVEDADVKMVWITYHNQRFDFCVDYPSNFLTLQGESENHDGNTFSNANGSSEMRASGIYNALDETIADAFERATENDRYYDEEKKITYKLQKDNWFVASGKYYESIFYLKSILVEDTFYTLYFEYHSSEATQFDEIIKRTTNDFPDC